MFRDIGAPEIMLILAVVVLLFGAKKLPELARGSGRALRIFKAETKGLMDDEDTETAAPKAIPTTEATPAQPPAAEAAQAEAERRTNSAD